MSVNKKLIAHIIFRLDVGGLENGLVNILNGLQQDKYSHAIICLKGYSDFKDRIKNSNVEFYDLDKREGKDIGCYFRLWKLLRKLKPEIVHTRNLPALDMVIPSFLAGVPARIHGEHGRDIIDIDGSNRKYQIFRKLLSPFISKFVALSEDLTGWLKNDVGIAGKKIIKICNGVDTDKFSPFSEEIAYISDCPFKKSDSNIVIGTIGRMEEVKDTINLCRAFVELVKNGSDYSDRLRLMLIGDGSLMAKVIDFLTEQKVIDKCWIPGSRSDTAEILRNMDIFVLPSLAEGISNTILEAMASGLPVIATNVGGNPELVENMENGVVVPSKNHQELAKGISTVIEDIELRYKMAKKSRQLALEKYSVNSMVDAYDQLYESYL